MALYLISRVVSMLLVLVIVTAGLFGLVHAAPGDPVTQMLSPEQLGASDAYINAMRHQLGLDRPLIVQYVEWISRVVRGDLGKSYHNNSTPVATLLLQRLPPTLELMTCGLLGSMLLALVLGVLAAAHKAKFTDYAISTTTLLIMSVPAFFLGMLAMYVFSFRFGWLPSTGMNTYGDGSVPDLMKHLILPGGVLALHGCAGMARFVRAGLLEELGSDYVRTASAKGASPLRMRMHALRNSLLPLITILMMGIPELLGGAVIIEQLFAWPGMGLLTFDAIGSRDYPTVIGFGLVVTILVLLSNFLADFLYRIADPRVGLG